VTRLEQQLGRKLAIDQLYEPWDSRPPLAVARWDISQGRIPMISWGGTVASQIAAGDYDRHIRAWAQQLRDLHSPVLLRWFWEMDLKANADKAVSPGSYIAAWRHIHDIFTSMGAANVDWVWCPDASGFAGGRAQEFYPGSSYVDWAGADGYNWAPKRGTWRSFAQIFSHFYQWGLSAGKPLMVAEFGVIEGQPGAKAGWIAQTGQEIRSSFPALRAIVYFDDDHRNFNQDFNWRLNTSPSALAAFRALAAEPYFAARSLLIAQR
jgi:endoglucanase